MPLINPASQIEQTSSTFEYRHGRAILLDMDDGGYTAIRVD